MPFVWVLVGASAVAGLVVFAATQREFREALGQVATALVAAPAILAATALVRAAPRALTLSPAALQRFAAQRTSRPAESAWLLGYRGRGVIVVRRVRDDGWLNDVPNRACRARRDAQRFDERPVARVVDEDPTQGGDGP